MRRWILLGTLLCGAGAVFGYGALAVYTAAGPLGADVDVEVPRGGLDSVGAALQRAGAIGSLPVFKAAAVATAWQGGLRSAEFALPAHASLAQILFILRAGRPVQHKVTIAEGLVAADIARVLARADGLAGDIEVPGEGAVLPETYLYEREASADSVIRRAAAMMRAVLDQAWATRAPDVVLASKQELVVVASLVERETHLPSEGAIFRMV
jgi:UPF0755 protein